jgi:hypothetical protein
MEFLTTATNQQKFLINKLKALLISLIESKDSNAYINVFKQVFHEIKNIKHNIEEESDISSLTGQMLLYLYGQEEFKGIIDMGKKQAAAIGINSEKLRELEIEHGVPFPLLLLSLHSWVTIVILKDREPSIKKYSNLFRAYTLPIKAIQKQDFDQNLASQWEQLETCSGSQTFSSTQSLIRNAKKGISIDEKKNYSEWICHDKGMRQQIFTLLFGNVSPKFLLHGDSNLSISTIRSLRLESWISKWIILRFSRLLQNESSNSTFMIYEGSDETILRFNASSKNRERNRVPLGDRIFIMLYPRCHNNHYTLYKVFNDPKEKKVIYMGIFDSMYECKAATTILDSSDDEVEKQLIKIYLYYLHLNFDDTEKYPTEKQIKKVNKFHAPVSLQKNTFDCGLFCMLYMSILTQSTTLNITDANQNYIDTYHIRYWILASILRNKVMLPQIKTNKI